MDESLKFLNITWNANRQFSFTLPSIIRILKIISLTSACQKLYPLDSRSKNSLFLFSRWSCKCFEKKNWPKCTRQLLIQKWNTNQCPHYENEPISTGNITFRLSFLVIVSSVSFLLLSSASIPWLDGYLFCSPNEFLEHFSIRRHFSCIQTCLWGHIKA